MPESKSFLEVRKLGFWAPESVSHWPQGKGNGSGEGGSMAMGTIKFPDTDSSLYGLNPLQYLVTDAELLAGGWTHRTGKRDLRGSEGGGTNSIGHRPTPIRPAVTIRHQLLVFHHVLLQEEINNIFGKSWSRCVIIQKNTSF